MIDTLDYYLSWSSLYFLSEWIIRLTMLVVVPLRRNPEAAKGWLLLIFFLPWLGLVLYWLIGRPRWPAWRVERLRKFPDALANELRRLASHPNIFHPQLAPDFAPAVTLARNLTRLPILGGNRVEWLDDYDAMIDRLASDIDAARHHVHLLFYIFADDALTARVVDALGRAVQRGVNCRVLADSLASRRSLRTLRPKLEALGVEVHELLPVSFFRRTSIRLDLRNHRKIAVIDGAIGYTGSQNLVSSNFKEGLVYEELMVRMEGPAVLELQFIFAADWFVETGRSLSDDSVFPDPAVAGDAPAQVVPSGPGFDTPNNQRLLVALIYAARRRVVITTPYFIPDDPLLQALQTAAARGVEVHVVLSQQADQWLVSRAQRSYYDELLSDGIQIHLYRERFLHAKHVSIDDEVAVIGSSNMDIRSFLLNSEVLLVIYDAQASRRLTAIQQRYFDHAERLQLEAWRARRKVSKFSENMARLMSPLL